MVQEPAKLSPKVVGQEFVKQYYTMLAKEPRYLHRFYGSHSVMIHGSKDDNQPAVGQVKIREKIKSLDFKDVYTRVAQLDAFMTIGNGICIQVAGEITNKQEPLRRFMQTFVLGPQEQDGKAPGTSFYVHNDIFRYQDDIFADEVASTEQASGDAPIQIDSNYQEEIINENEIEPEYQEPPAPLAPEPEPVVEPEPVEAEEPKQEEPEPEPVVEVVPEPAPVEPEIVEEPVVEVAEVAEEVEKVQIKEPAPAPVAAAAAPQPTQPAKPAAPLSWAERMRAKQGAAAPQAAPAPAPVAPAPIPAKPEQNGTTEPEFPPVQNGSTAAPAAQPQREQHHQRENGNKDGRFNREYNNDRPRRDYNDDKQQIFVGGLPADITEAALREVFSHYGTVKHVRITNRGLNSHDRSGQAGFGFVTFQKESEARKALDSKDGIYYANFQLNVEEKKTRGERPRDNNFQRQNGNYKPRDGGRRGGDYQSRDQNQGQRAQGRQSYGQDGRRDRQRKF